MAVVIAAAVFKVKVSANVLRPERPLNFAEAITIQAAYGIERLSR
jgi:hypothetical protein